MSASLSSTPATPTSPSPRSLPIAEVGYLIQLVVVAALPLVNAIFFDWDAGMVAGLLVIEVLTVQLCLPFGWIAVDALWHRQMKRDEAARNAALARGEDVPARTPKQEKRAAQAQGPWPWWKAIPGALFLSLFALAFGGLLPVLMLSVLSPAWLEWGANGAVTLWDVPRMLAFFVWPLTLAHQLADEWPSFVLSAAMIVLVVTGPFVAMMLQGLRGHQHPAEIDDGLMFQLGAVSVPLFIMSGIAHAVGSGFTQKRLMTGVFADVDPLMMTLVVLMVFRSIAAATRRHEDRMVALRAAGDAQGAHAAGNRWLSTLGVSVLGLAVLGGIAFALSEPRIPESSPRPACESVWTGAFSPESPSLAELGAPWMSEPAVACERLRTATSLRLTAPIDPADFDWFTGVVHLELHRGAVAHVADLDRLPALGAVQIVDAEEPVDARTLRARVQRQQLTITRSTVHHAESLWAGAGWKTLALQDVTLEQVERRTGRAAVEDLVLTNVRGDVETFLHGGLGVKRLRVVGAPPPVDWMKRLLWLERFDVDPDVDDTAWCDRIRGRFRMQSTRAQDACGHRYSMPP